MFPTRLRKKLRYIEHIDHVEIKKTSVPENKRNGI